MKVSNVVDDQTEGEWPTIGIAGKVLRYLGVVVGRLVVSAVITDPIGEVLKSANNIVGWLLEGKVRKAATLV